MKMKKYVVTMQVTGQIDIEVKATCFEDAIDKAGEMLPEMDWNKLEATDYETARWKEIK